MLGRTHPRGGGYQVDEPAYRRRGVVGPTCDTHYGGRHTLACDEREARTRVEGLGGRRAEADAAPGDDVFPPFVDGPGDRSDDPPVTACPWVDQPVVPPACRVTAVGRGLRCDPGKPGHVGEPELVALGQGMAGRQDEHPWLLRDRFKADPGGG